MGVAESKELLSDYLDEATVRKLAGEYFDKALFDTLATDDVVRFVLDFASEFKCQNHSIQGS